MYLNIYPSIYKATLPIDGRKMSSTVISLIFQIKIFQIFQIYTIQTKIWAWHFKQNVKSCFQIWELDHIFSHLVFLSYVPGLYFVSPPYVVIINLLQREEGVGIHCKLMPDWIESNQARLNKIELIMDIISIPIQSRMQ